MKDRLHLNSGTLRVLNGAARFGNSDSDALFLLEGDAVSRPVISLQPDEDVSLPLIQTGLRESDFFLTVYHFNDLHGHLARFNPGGVDAVISRMAWQVEQKRQSVALDPQRAVMLFSAGDDCVGSVFDELIGSTSDDFGVHASYRLYSAMGMDAGCLGNHDFDLGLPLLSESIRKDARFPLLAANISDCEHLAGLCYPAMIKVIKGIRVGVIGLVTQAELKITDPKCQVTDPVIAAGNLLGVMRSYCDVVIILSHLGYSLSNSSTPMVAAGDVELAQKLPYGSVQLIVGGHSHHELNPQGLSPKNIVNGIPIVQTGALGRYLGQVDIKIGRKSAAVSNVRLLPVPALAVDQRFEEQEVQPLIRQARELFARSLGVVSADPALGTDHVRNSFASGELALANFITDAMITRLPQSNHAVDLTMIDSSSLRKGLSQGQEVTFGDWFNVMPFADTVRIYKISGRELYDLLQDNAKRVDRPNEPNTERGFLQFSAGLRYTISLEAERAKSKAVQITVNGLPLEEQFDKEFLLAGTSFIREYANSWEALDEQHPKCCFFNLETLEYIDTEIFLRKEIMAYIQAAGGVTKDGGAVLDGRLVVIENTTPPVTTFSLEHFVEHVSEQKHAMAGAVIASSAAQAVALGRACAAISLQNGSGSAGEPLAERAILSELDRIKEKLLQFCNNDANAIAEFAALRESGQELRGKELLGMLPIQISSHAIQAANLLEGFRSRVDERVRDDLEMSIKLLSGSASTAMLLLDSNLRIWPDMELLEKFEPQLNDLLEAIAAVSAAERIRQTDNLSQDTGKSN